MFDSTSVLSIGDLCVVLRADLYPALIGRECVVIKLFPAGRILHFTTIETSFAPQCFGHPFYYGVKIVGKAYGAARPSLLKVSPDDPALKRQVLQDDLNDLQNQWLKQSVNRK